jgi:hypothetical protein
MSTEETKAVVGHHIQSMARGNMEAILSDFTEESVVYWSEGSSKGLAEIQVSVEHFLNSVPEGFWKNAKTLRAVFDGEVGYTLWESAGVPLGTDTYIVRNGKIMVKTFAAYIE